MRGFRRPEKGLLMSSDELAIRVSNLSKCYNIYDAPRDRLKQFILPKLQRLAGQTPQRYFSEFWALKDVSFEVRQGETVGIIGRNGSGKSTLLQLIAGTLAPTGGSVEVKGRIAALLELGSGFNADFTGRENVFISGGILGLAREEIESRFDEIAEFAGIGSFIEQPVKTYSSGMLVRLAFAVSVCVEPEILIVDEALAVGDEKFQRKCFARLDDLKSRGASILFVSHSGPQIIELCGRALLLENGKRVMCAHPPRVVRSYQRLIYAPDAAQAQLLQEFHAADMVDEPQGERIAGSALPANRTAPKPDETFDPDLVPETTTAYPVRGAEIERLQIQDINGRVVNLLRPSERYRIIMSGSFLENFDKITFGIHIRSISGTVISGQRYPEEGRFAENLRAGSKFKIDFWFNMALSPDTYFAGGGIWSATDANYVHRVLDAIMFRVQSEGPQSSFGCCNLIAAPADFKVF
jgi:lipopolysaccharide transport system ATP-binding protein